MFTHNNPASVPSRSWTNLAQPMTRRTYVRMGAALLAIQYAGAVALVYSSTGTWWTPGDPLDVRALTDPSTAFWVSLGLLVWKVPFLAAAVILSARRAHDAGWSPWFATLFFVPYARYVLLLALALLPSRSRRPGMAAVWPARSAREGSHPWIAVPLGVAVTLIFFFVLGARENFRHIPNYGGWLFLLLPFVMGATSGFVHNLGRTSVHADTTMISLLTLLTSGITMLGLAMEGAICIVMALPLSFPLAIFGGAVGGSIATIDPRRSRAMFMLATVPLTGAIEPRSGDALYEVESSVVIDATAAEVWPHVVSFSELPPPDDLLFRAGIAYPVRARIEGTGIGAVRYCEFSTGAFVEPITAWEPGRRLAFDVTSSPPTMHELSPYPNLSPPHLHGYLRSQRGEFRLVDLGDGRTRLEGSTWYQLEMAPEAYWRLLGDALIGRIHHRVLEHIKRESERHGS